MERILELAKKKGCQEAEVFYRSETASPVEFENNKLKQVQTTADSGFALRVLKDGRIGFATSTKEGDYDLLVDNAIAISLFGNELKHEFPGSAALPTVKNWDDRISNVSVEQMVEMGRQMVEIIQEYDSQVLGGARAARTETEVWIINSRGFDARYRANSFALAAFAILVEGQNFLTTYDWQQLAKFEVDPVGMARRVVEEMKIARRNAPIKSGTYPAILTPSGLLDCFGPIGASVDGQAVYKGLSPWKDKVGQRVAAETISIYDDGTYDYATGTRPFDDEGTPSQRTPIIQKGVLKNFLFDRKTAAAMKTSATGNGKRPRLTSPVSISSTTVVMEPGDSSFQAMVAGMKEGVIIDSLMGAWAGNPYSGMVNGNVQLGYKVENGEIVGRIKDCMFSLNLFEALLSGIVAISQERRFRGESVVPYVMIDAGGISTKS